MLFLQTKAKLPSSILSLVWWNKKMILHADAKNFFDTFFVSAEKTYYIFDRGPTSD